MNDSLLYLLCGAATVLAALNFIFVLFSRKGQDLAGDVDNLRNRITDEMRATRQEMTQSVQASVSALGTQIAESQKQGLEAQSRSIRDLTEQQNSHNKRTDDRLGNMSDTIEKRLGLIQEDNTKKLEQMRQVVDEKLQTTLNERLNQSFSQVSERLEQVYKGLGEMQTLATGVGDLKKILSNVKTRGIFGEIQLGSILEQILHASQYSTNVRTNPDASGVVEYAIKLPGDGDTPVWLPVDAKFPVDLYSHLLDAYDSGDSAAVLIAQKQLEQGIKEEAKKITKYIAPPGTTDFAIMFLPTEGLYAEVVRGNLVEMLQRDYRITVAGPTTMAALLNALQMGFRTLALQKSSSEVWQVLGAVKTEFTKFETVLKKTQSHLSNAGKSLDELIAPRTNAIYRKLREVSALPDSEAVSLIGAIETGPLGDDEL